MTMRIYGPNGTTLGSPASNARRTGSTGFSLPDASAVPDEVRSAAAPKAAASLDALMALQGIEDPTERRKRSVARGKGALDVLDDLKLGLLSGSLNAATVSRSRVTADSAVGDLHCPRAADENAAASVERSAAGSVPVADC